MKLLVAVKSVVDPNIKIHVKSEGRDIDTTHLKKVMNPFDEIAVEEAIRLKEQGKATEVVVVSLGTQAAQEVLRHALALGVDRAILVQTDQVLSPLMVAKLLKAVALAEKPQIILLGKQAVDSDNNQVGQMLAGILAWSQGAFISSLQVTAGEAVVTREVDGGLETLALKLPTVLTTDLRLNTPRYATLPNIVKAKQKPCAIFTPEQLQITLAEPKYKTIKTESPAVRRTGVRVSSAKELIEKLKNEAKIL